MPHQIAYAFTLLCKLPMFWATSYTHSLSHVQPFAATQLVARQAHLSMDFSKQEYWSRLPFPIPGDLPDPGIEPVSLAFLALAGGLFTTVPPGENLRARNYLAKQDPKVSGAKSMSRFTFPLSERQTASKTPRDPETEPLTTRPHQLCSCFSGPPRLLEAGQDSPSCCSLLQRQLLPQTDLPLWGP